MKYECAQPAPPVPEKADATVRAAGRTAAAPDEIVRFRMLLEQTLAAPADEAEDENTGGREGNDMGEAAQTPRPGGLPQHGRSRLDANGGRYDTGGRPAARAFPSDSFAAVPGRKAAAPPEARRRPPAAQSDANARPQDVVASGGPATGADMFRDLVAEILFAVELPDRRHAIGVEMHSAVLPGTRICLAMNDHELSVRLQTHSEPVYRDALARRNTLVQALAQRCARAVVVEIEFDA